ncbi:YqiA/YcfP family alpha/beta fold hydrolase [Celerinatantimonas yamalensis]|uniref:YqiA/YcfP family alpha/beta fold hydrolase n=1 Tax=Celerinatantimonas yamalensis TaxID=559956 RepID=A0ABW9G564_9GAMM
MARYLLFIHGYQGSSQSYKGACLRQYLQTHNPDTVLLIPQLACYPQPAWLQIREILDTFAGELIGIVGASMGGLMAAKASVDSGLPAVLVNPLADLSIVTNLLGEHIHPQTQEQYRLNTKHLEQLKEMQIAPERCSQRQWLILQTGDELLDFQQALKMYPHTKQTIECGGNHGFAGFARYVPAIIQFLLNNKKI